MNTVYFDSLNSYYDLNLLLESKEIEVPTAKTEYVEVPGCDGKIDFSEFFGEINYEDRKIKLDFNMINSDLEKLSSIQNKLHSKKMKIVFSDDDKFFYYGRVSIKSCKLKHTLGIIEIEVDAEPYKLKKDITTITETINSEKTVVCNNLKKSVVPEIKTNSEFEIEFNKNKFTHSSGTFVIPEILLKEGKNEIKFKGNGTVTVTYIEGCL